MNLTTVNTLHRPASAAEVTAWQDGYAWLAGGTWLFSEPQPRTDTLIDLVGLGWKPLESDESGLTIAATCRIADLFRLTGPGKWTALPLFRECCDAFLASFKIWNASTVGGNVCMSLPAGPMISLAAALEGVCTLWPLAGSPREVAVVDFVTGNHQNVLQRGELLRSIYLPATALSKRYVMRQISLTKLGRSAALIIGTSGTVGDMLLTITAATDRPVQIRFPEIPTAAELGDTIESLPADRWFSDVHGSADYKHYVTRYLAEQIRGELAR